MAHISSVLPQDPNGSQLAARFSYPWKSIQAANTTHKVQWQTQDYPLRPRILWHRWQDANILIGVRFGHQTTCGLLDIDIGSPYCNPQSVSEIRIALETIGITRTLLIRSSRSGGLHLYFPFEQPVPTFGLAVVVSECLKAQGFDLKNGTLEVFPNVKTYGIKIFTEYQGHRLPLQPASGSCILDDNLSPIGDSLTQFFREWGSAAAGQDLEQLQMAIPHAREARKQICRRRSLSPKTESWQADLETELAEGWSGPGQTNHLLKIIGCYGIVFLGIEDIHDLTQYIVETATSLPGYRQYCGHQHEIHKRARSWANSTRHLYYPLGTRSSPKPKNSTNINQQRSTDAQRRITEAVAQLKATLSVPLHQLSLGNLARCITRIARCSLTTLYKYPVLWKPQACVTPDAETVSIDLNSRTSSDRDPPKSCEIKALHTQGGDMKCSPLTEASSSTLSLPNRGVRGDESRFPQLSQMQWEALQPAIQQKIRELGWQLREVHHFLSARFQGRQHLWELQASELMALLYYLQCEVLPDG
ncbi:MAG: hypothetical protein AAF215_10070 [Cyanobacteria bacterium P01_A01_bin.123]